MIKTWNDVITQFISLKGVLNLQFWWLIQMSIFLKLVPTNFSITIKPKMNRRPITAAVYATRKTMSRIKCVGNRYTTTFLFQIVNAEYPGIRWRLFIWRQHRHPHTDPPFCSLIPHKRCFVSQHFNNGPVCCCRSSQFNDVMLWPFQHDCKNRVWSCIADFFTGSVPNILRQGVILKLPWSALIYRFAVDVQPFAKVTKAFFEYWSNNTVSSWAEIQNNISTITEKCKQSCDLIL